MIGAASGRKPGMPDRLYDHQARKSPAPETHLMTRQQSQQKVSIQLTRPARTRAHHRNAPYRLRHRERGA